MPRLTRVITTAMAAAVALTVTAAVPAVAAQHRPAATTSPKYYLALGDSLSVGLQPNAKGVDQLTNQGYADQLYTVLKQKTPNLKLVKLGCPGETSLTINVGGICGYKGQVRTSLNSKTGIQLEAAAAFLRAHRGQVPLITLDIGANDLNPCIALGDITKIAQCLEPVFPRIAKNLQFTLTKLRQNDPQATIVGMNYYDPELAAWLTGTSGQAFAKASLVLAAAFRNLLVADYTAFKDPYAKVYGMFKTDDMTDMVNVPGIGMLPEDVALICQNTWECTPKPVGPNEHANKAGYAVIAGAFVTTLRGIHFPV